MKQPAAKGTGRANRPIPALARQRGLSLVEIMVTMVLLSILVLGLSGLWANVSADFLSLTLRQKAVFVLNGEMERLSALYRFTSFDSDHASSTGYATSPRFIYPDSAGTVAVVGDIVTQTGTVFDCGVSTCAGRVLHDPSSVAADDDRVYVWLDQERKMTARLSWRLRDPPVAAGVTDFQNCSDGGTAGDGASPGGTASCQELTVYLEFPYRYSSAASPDTDAGLGKTEELSLVTIVGRRP